jgi:general secretion pathway protein J
MRQQATGNGQRATGNSSARISADYWLLATDYAGFTLLEVLVASAILSLVLAALYGVFSQTLTSKRLAEERAEQARTARIALLRIGEDLQSALPPTSREIHFLGKTRLTQEFPEDTLSFVTLTRAAMTTRTPEGDLSEVAYGVEPDPSDITQKQLVRRVRFTLSPRNDAADEAAPILLHVHGLRFRFFDGHEWQEEWRQEQTHNQLPRAVETTVYVADPQGKILPFSTVITLPLAETKRGKAA